MAKQKMRCVFSGQLCRDCALFRGRHYYLCFARAYRGYLGAEIQAEKSIGAHYRLFDEGQHPPSVTANARGRSNPEANKR
jgi:hypothetical protein